MRVRVQTDNGNCNIAAAEDPGFFAKWTFLENGALPRPRLPPADSVVALAAGSVSVAASDVELEEPLTEWEDVGSAL